MNYHLLLNRKQILPFECAFNFFFLLWIVSAHAWHNLWLLSNVIAKRFPVSFVYNQILFHNYVIDNVVLCGRRHTFLGFQHGSQVISVFRFRYDKMMRFNQISAGIRHLIGGTHYICTISTSKFGALTFNYFADWNFEQFVVYALISYKITLQIL